MAGATYHSNAWCIDHEVAEIPPREANVEIEARMIESFKQLSTRFAPLPCRTYRRDTHLRHLSPLSCSR